MQEVTQRLCRRDAAAHSRGFLDPHKHVHSIGQSKKPGVSRLQRDSRDHGCGSGDNPRLWCGEVIEESQRVPREEREGGLRQRSQGDAKNVQRDGLRGRVATWRQQ